MSGEQKKLDYLKEHLSYEYSMARWTFRRLNSVETTQLLWNALFESFIVHFRNISTFLKNVEKNNGNYKASDFEAKYTLSKIELKIIEGLSPRLESQVMHLGKSRGKNANQIDIDDIQKAYLWCDSNLKKFVLQLPLDFQTAWQEGLFDEGTSLATIDVGPKGPISTSSHPIMSTISITGPNSSK